MFCSCLEHWNDTGMTVYVFRTFWIRRDRFCSCLECLKCLLNDCVGTENPPHSWGLRFRQTPRSVTPRYRGLFLRRNTKNGAHRTKDTRKMTICEVMIIKSENICVGVYWNNVGVLGWKLWCRVQRRSETNKTMTFDGFLLHVPIHLLV